MDASRKIGLDLGKYGGGQEDGRYNAKISNTFSKQLHLLTKCVPIKKIVRLIRQLLQRTQVVKLLHFVVRVVKINLHLLINLHKF
jgi:hypothetical protein